MLQSKEPKSAVVFVTRVSPFAYIDESRDTRCLRPSNTQLLRIIDDARAIHLPSSNGWAEFWPKPMKFYVDILSYAH